ATVDTPIDYINSHGTSTPVGDTKELEAIGEVFGEDIPPISSSKSLTGHSLGAVGAQEAIYCLMMMEEGFIQASANITELDEQAQGFPIVTERRDGVALNTVMTNNFGFGGTNATLVLRKAD
ncbi:MAG TPA: beta-ketoacyl-ACP synthase I, partial [Chromatiales bacterium]|nr:beta-ketoacyl-ACP synthase I [Chromatiales bacterium]